MRLKYYKRLTGGKILDLYISDLDGTLLNSKQVVSEISAEIINKLIDDGLNFTIATARSYDASKGILQPLKLKLPVILNNGAFVYDPISHKNIAANYLKNEDAEFILRSYHENNISPLISAIDSKGNKKIFYKDVFNKGQEIYLNSRKENKDKRLTKVEEFSLIENYRIINIFAIERRDVLDTEYKIFTDKLNISCQYTEEIYSRGYFWLETTNLKANKSSAAKFLKNYLNVDRLICFGDNLNDKSLFELSDTAYAVENAYKEIKNLATGIIDSNNNNGVAKFLNQIQ